MHKKNYNHRITRRVIRPAILSLSVLAAINLSAQQVLIAPPARSDQSLHTEQTGDTNQTDNAENSSVSTSAISDKNPFQWGPVVLHPHFTYGFSYGTGLLSQPGQANRSIVNTVSPGIDFDLGKHWGLGYTASAAFYSDPSFKNNVDHNLTLHGNTAYEDWTFNLSQNVAISSDPLIETAQQTDEQAYSTALGVSYQISSDWSAEFTAAQNLIYSQGITNSIGSSEDWTLSGSLNYLLGPGLSTGLSVGFGYNTVGIGPDMTYENVNGQFNWQIARKLNLSLNAGAQIRQFIGSGQSSLVSPTFGVALSYYPLDFTAITLSASRGISASYFQDEVNESTSLSAGLSQRLFQNYYLSLSAGYGLSSYQDTTLMSAAFHGREDTRSFFAINLSRSFLKRGTLNLSYSKSQNSSNSSGYSYNSDQIGFSMAYGY